MLGEKRLVERVEVVVPDVHRKPRAARRPRAASARTSRPCNAPDVGVVVRHPALRAVDVARGLRACDGELVAHLPDGLREIAEARWLRRPVVHLRVDVHGVVARPRRPAAVVPDSLKVERLRSRLRAGDEKVASEAEVQRRKVGIACFGEALKTLERRLPRTRIASEVERAAVGLSLVERDMVRLRLGVWLLHRGSELAERLCARVAGKVAEVPEVRADRDIEDYVVRVLDSEHAALRGHASALRYALHYALELQHTLALGLVAVYDRVVPFGNDGSVLPRRKYAGLEGDRALLGRRNPPDNDVVGEARERLADVLHPAAGQLHARNRRVERKRALVLLRLRLVAEVDFELAEVLVRA